MQIELVFISVIFHLLRSCKIGFYMYSVRTDVTNVLKRHEMLKKELVELTVLFLFTFEVCKIML